MSQKWKSLIHNGPMFQQKYKRLPPQVKLLYRKNTINLNANAEEAAVLYAKFLIANHKLTKDRRFNSNFFEDFRDLLNNTQQDTILQFSQLNFSRIKKHLKKPTTTVLRKRNLGEKYSYCKINGKKEPIGNYKVEPAGIFIGRGDHPWRGRIKNRIQPQDVVINCSRENIPRGNWKDVIHDKTVTWLAKYTNSLGETKYIQVGQSSNLRTRDDRDKYELARTLGNNIEEIRGKYEKLLSSQIEWNQQMGVAIYFIDRFALRIGNEKGPEKADTVGCLTLRKEHVTLQTSKKIKFNFKGKDSIKFENEFKLPLAGFRNLEKMIQNKGKKDKLFHLLNAQDVNLYLKELQPDLTAKVFRTFTASSLFEKELNKEKITRNYDEIDLCRIFNNANLAVAKICNHKKTVNKQNFLRAEKRLHKTINDKKVKLREIETQQGTESPQYQRTKLSLKRSENFLELKKSGREFALNTSKQNYIDPRITVAWCSKNSLSLNHVWSKTLIKKYTWAEKTKRSFQF